MTAASSGSTETTLWGPTEAELSAAQAEVATWDVDRLAGQVIVGRFHGTAPDDAADLVTRLHLAGLCLTTSNISSRAQVKALNDAVHAAVHGDGRDIPAVLSVDQEGGTTAHLGDNATRLPTFLSAGAAVAGDRARSGDDSGAAAVHNAAQATALELRGLGFTWVFAPVADVTIGRADPTIGTRAPSDDPEIASAATVAAVHGFNDGGIVSTLKHYPGHGSVTADSHKALPEQDASLAQLTSRDLVPFAAGAKAGAPVVMMSHIAVTAFDPGVPASVSAAAYQSLTTDVGFTGLTITDSLGMGAVRRGGDPGVRALIAGADLLLMPADTEATHRAVVAAITDGRISRARITTAASKVVALQRWQARKAALKRVPADIADEARLAAQGLSAAAVTRVATTCPKAPEPPLTSVRLVSGSADNRRRFAAAARHAGLGIDSGPTLSLTGAGADINASTGWPTAPSGRRSYALYGDTPGAFAAFAAVLRGTAAARGGLPINLPDAAACPS